MDFELTEEQSMVRDMARDFAQAELAPRARKHDADCKIDPEIFQMLAELGMWGLTVEEELGGAGMGNLELCLVLEEINAACASTGVTVSVHNSLLAPPIKRFGTEEQIKRWVPELASGERIGCYCLTEPNAGSDAGAVKTAAVRDGDDWILDGTKTFVTNGAYGGLAIVYARSDPSTPGPKGMSAFIVPMETPGVTVGKAEKKTGIRGSSTTEILLDKVRLPADALLGKEGGGFPIAMDTLDGGRIGIACQSLGIGRACLQSSIRYAKEREQFGKPIGYFQAIQWKLADMSTRIDASRLLTHRAALKRDKGERCSFEAAEAKLLASTTANWAADETVQIYGGAGYTDDFEVERLFRDARITEIYEGATDIQRIVIARSLLA